MSVANTNPFQRLGVDGADEAPAQPVAAAKPQREQQAAPRVVPGTAQAMAAKAMDDEPLPRDQRGSARVRNERGRGRGGRSDRGRGGGRGRGRVHDRHSGTGREDTAKSVRQGWGGEDAKSEANMEEAAKADAVKEAEAAEAEAKAAAQRKEEEEEEKTLTLAEFQARQAEKRAQLGAVAQPRTVEADEASYGQRLEKNDEAYFAGVEKKTSAPRQRKETKQTIEFEPVYEQPTARGRGERGPSRGGARGGGRGGRGGARSGRGGRGDARGASRGGRGGRGGRAANNQPVVNLQDENAFPSLA